MARDENVMNEIIEKVDAERDWELTQQGNLGSIGRTVARAFPGLAADQKLWAEAEEEVGMRLDMNEPNCWETYRDACVEVCEEHGIPLPGPTNEEVAEFQRIRGGIQELAVLRGQDPNDI